MSFGYSIETINAQRSYEENVSNFVVNSLRPSDTIWRQRSGSTLAQVMACCQDIAWTNIFWLIISEVQWHSYQANFTRDIPQPSLTKIHLKITYLKFHSNFSGANELTLFLLMSSHSDNSLCYETTPYQNYTRKTDYTTTETIWNGYDQSNIYLIYQFLYWYVIFCFVLFFNLWETLARIW